jgi:NAD+ diphosphatase
MLQAQLHHRRLATSIVTMEEIYCFGGNPLDRASERRRDTLWIQSLLDDPAARILPLCELRPLIRGEAVPELDWQPVEPWRERIARGATCIFLGLDEARPYFAVDGGPAEAGPAGQPGPVDARTLAPLLSGGEAAILAEARSLIDWHARHRFCAQCGSPTRVASAGWVRRCPECKASHYPRSDPVTIMLAVRGDYGLLGRGRRRPGARFSCLAGFMEPGETLEEAVRREVHEESGVRVGRVKYLACQPWPFPSSLMMGFLCEALSEEITVDPEELAEARWFHRDEIRAMVARAVSGPDDPAQVSVPGPVAIAHHICRRWSNGLDTL